MTKFCRKCNCETVRQANGRCKPCDQNYKKAALAANPDKARAYCLAWRTANPEKMRAAVAAWSSANPEKRKAGKAMYRAANLEMCNASSAKWRAVNKEKCRAISARWRAANPESKRIFDQNRRARKRSSGGKLSNGLTQRLFKLQRGRCACCGVKISDENHLDHVVPLALNGQNEDWNMQLLCPPCNQQKHAKHPIDFMQSRGFLL